MAQPPAEPYRETAPPVLEGLAQQQPAAPLPNTATNSEAAAPETVDFEQQKLDEAKAYNEAIPEASAAPIGQKTVPPSTSMSRQTLQGIAGLLLVLALIVVARGVLARWGRRTGILVAPKLASQLGRIYLDRGICLHFLSMGGRILVIGATAQSVRLVAEFDEAAFDAQSLQPLLQSRAGTQVEGKTPEQTERLAEPTPRVRFMDYLKASTRAMTRPVSPPAEDDDEIASLRSDIQRLQEYLRELPRERKE